MVFVKVYVKVCLNVYVNIYVKVYVKVYVTALKVYIRVYVKVCVKVYIKVCLKSCAKVLLGIRQDTSLRQTQLCQGLHVHQHLNVINLSSSAVIVDFNIPPKYCLQIYKCLKNRKAMTIQ